METQQFLQQLIIGLNQLEVKGDNVHLLSFLMKLTNEYINGLANKEKQVEVKNN